jgi:hypothetical protein
MADGLGGYLQARAFPVHGRPEDQPNPVGDVTELFACSAT